MGRIAVFIDRDGTINKESGYIDRPDMIDLIPGSAKAIKIINKMGLNAVVVTNQSGIGRSYFKEESLMEVHRRLKELLMEEGAYIDAIYYCPHHPHDNCECRKPMPGLLKRAASELEIDLCSSYVVGDKISDLILAQKVGAKGILVKTGYGLEAIEDMSEKEVIPDMVAEDLLGAVSWIKKDIKRY
ncbi:MAG TPA: D-glycero-beta-D-manno-heptose 1,7-bisphosphate 7-phosphatase [Nitrospiria bacterium]|nr:D-glycero-beta-D-manno-heptose 1,7-bisphosphate 7-phosphatase [Nitrospiria bacterium]